MKISPLAALGCLIILASCQQATSSSSSTPSFTVVTTNTDTAPKYYSLATGKVVTDPANNTWDIAFGNGSQAIYTNSGYTATASGVTGSATSGVGGVYYAGTTAWGGVSSYSTSKFADSNGDGNADTFGTDYYTEFNTVADGSGTASFATLNVITKLEYSAGDGTHATPFVKYPSSDVTDPYSGPAYYTYDTTDQANPLKPSKEVYVVRSGDGTKYYKIQITAMGSTTDSSGFVVVERTRTVSYSRLTSGS